MAGVWVQLTLINCFLPFSLPPFFPHPFSPFSPHVCSLLFQRRQWKTKWKVSGMLHLSSSLINGGTRFPINCVAITRLSFLQVCQTLPSPPTESSERSGVHYPEFHAANHPFCLSSLSPLLILCFSAPWSFTFAKSTTACCTVKLNISTGVIIFFF